jgi:hypothetical protein
MIKLKDILSEAYAWERTPGRPLPTLAEVQAEYQRNGAADKEIIYGEALACDISQQIVDKFKDASFWAPYKNTWDDEDCKAYNEAFLPWWNANIKKQIDDAYAIGSHHYDPGFKGYTGNYFTDPQWKTMFDNVLKRIHGKMCNLLGIASAVQKGFGQNTVRWACGRAWFKVNLDF